MTANKSTILPARNVPLKKRNTFGFDVSAEFFVETQNEEQIQEALEWAKNERLRVMPLGSGSNLLITGNLQGLILRQRNEDTHIVNEDEKGAVVFASAGSNWHQLVLFCVEHDLYGIENLSLIPGLAGAAPIQNIGAYGVELADVLTHLDAISIATGKKVTINNSDCRFAYRESAFKQNFKDQFIISGIYLTLSKTPRYSLDYPALRQAIDDSGQKVTLKQISQLICDIRRLKLPDPKTIGNAGSFFKNPLINAQLLEKVRLKYPTLPFHKQNNGNYKIPAAWLVERAGWKGFRRGSVGVHNKQAIVMINYGQGCGLEVLKLAEEIKSDIYLKFCVTLEIEPQIL